MQQRLKDMQKETSDAPGATVAEKLKERGFGGLAPANAPPSMVLKDMELKAKQGTNTKTPHFPDMINKALLPAWTEGR